MYLKGEHNHWKIHNMHSINGWVAPLINDSIPLIEAKTKKNQLNTPSPKTSPIGAMLSQQTEFQP